MRKLLDAGEGVGVSVNAHTREDVTVYQVDYCAYQLLQRTISSKENGSITHGEFEVCSHLGHTGIYTMPNTVSADETDQEPELPTS